MAVEFPYSRPLHNYLSPKAPAVLWKLLRCSAVVVHLGMPMQAGDCVNEILFYADKS